MSGWVGSVRICALPLVVSLASLTALQARPKVHSKVRSKPESTAVVSTAGRVTDVRFFSLADATRIAVEVTSDFQFRTDRLSNPERLFFDISGVKPARVPKGTEIIPVGDSLVKQIRIAETQPGATRIVLDLSAPVQSSVSQLSNPNRLIIELRSVDKNEFSPITSATNRVTIPEKQFEPPPSRAPAAIVGPKLQVPRVLLPAPVPNAVLERTARATFKGPNAPPPDMSAATAKPAEIRSPSFETPLLKPPEPPSALAARRNSTGEQSMTRVLGLKLGRVVLDAGHGGHDGGTRGPSGLLEKDLVLDVSKRLGALIEARLGSEVVFTREDDTFIPLEERTRIANRHKADLFLSIHANSSPVKVASGIETYYLNFTTEKAALEVAARENASSERSIYELRDLLQKIAMKDKLEESREFAAHVQSSLSALSARTNVKSKDRGVRKAPFVVLIGASMPSVLAEIGFVSNPKDEGLMKKAEYRQKIAEALYKGVAQYAAGLSHFQVARQKIAE
jgi:N-acetylmuramoyl-L-alanine amidase